MTSKLRAAALLVLVGAAFAGGRALAGIPSSDTLHYSGILEKASGEPLTGDHFIELKLWHEASGGAEPADCATKSEKYPLISGHFSVPLPAACVDAIARYSDTFVELIVDGAPLGRAKLGTVPYAVKADSAKTAESAAGELK